jgi:hypothetical protein
MRSKVRSWCPPNHTSTLPDAGRGLIPASSIVPAALEGDVRLGPQRLHDLHLFLGTAAAVMEILVETGVLSFVPADPDAEPEPAAAQNVKAGRLLGDKHRLALRQNQDAGREPELRCAAGEIAEQHERVVEQIFRIVAVPARPARGIDPEHVVGGLEEVVADAFRRLREFAHDVRIAADVAQRQ